MREQAASTWCHSSPDTGELLAAVRGIGTSCGSAIPPGVDFMHFDFHFLNLLSDGATITAPATRRHLRLARLILVDIGEPGPSRYVLR